MTVSISNMNQVWMSNTNTYNAIAMSVSTMGNGANSNSSLFKLDLDGNTKFRVYTDGSLYAPGSVIQVVQSSTITQSSTTSANYSHPVNCNIDIKPKSASSKILIRMIASIYIDTAAGGCGLAIYRGATPIWVPASSSTTTGPWGSLYSGGGGIAAQVPIEYLDSPGTTNTITYNLNFARYNTGTVYINYNGTAWSGATVMTAMEIAA